MKTIKQIKERLNNEINPNIKKRLEWMIKMVEDNKKSEAEFWVDAVKDYIENDLLWRLNLQLRYVKFWQFIKKKEMLKEKKGLLEEIEILNWGCIQNER